MDRRQFLRGSITLGVGVVLGGANPEHKTYGLARYSTDGITWTEGYASAEYGQRMARLLAHSMRETKEQVSANVLNRAFGPGMSASRQMEKTAHLRALMDGAYAAEKVWWDGERFVSELIPREDFYQSVEG